MDLIKASRRGDLEKVKKLLRPKVGKGVDPNITDEDIKSSLFWASLKGHLEIVPAKPGAKRKNFSGPGPILI